MSGSQQKKLGTVAMTALVVGAVVLSPWLISRFRVPGQ